MNASFTVNPDFGIQVRAHKAGERYWLEINSQGDTVYIHGFSAEMLERFGFRVHREIWDALVPAPAIVPREPIDPAFTGAPTASFAADWGQPREDVNMSAHDHAVEAAEAREPTH